VVKPITNVTERWLITAAVMSAAVMQVLDMTIVNVSLPHMQGSLSAAPDQITWVLTSYLIASAIFMPLTGYFADKFGRKNYLLFSIGGFVFSSALCGLASSVTEMVIFRSLQGVFGAALAPLSQAILADTYHKEEQGKAMAIWGIGIMIGPILGPTLGGYLTDIASWRWNFYINVPVGILSLFLAWQYVPATEKRVRSMDWAGLAWISLAIASLQYVLDKGNEENWFDSTNIKIAVFLAVLGLLCFIAVSSKKKLRSVFDIEVFKDRNFLIASLLIAVLGVGMFGTMVIQPLLLEVNLNYPVLTAGLAMAPRGIGGILSMLVVAKMVQKYDPRYLISFGILIAAGSNWVGTHYTIMMSSWWFTIPLFIQGFGMGFIFVPLSTLAYSTLPHYLRAEAAGIYSLLRTLGSSIGISVIITLYARHNQLHWNTLASHVQATNLDILAYTHLPPFNHNPEIMMDVIANEVRIQAQMLSFVDMYAFITWSFLLMLPLVFLIKSKISVYTDKEVPPI